MAKNKITERDFLIEQCLRDAYCDRTGEMLDEGFGDWLAGKKAKLGAQMSNVKTGLKNAAGRVANTASNVVGAAKHANKSRKLNKYADQLSDIGSALGNSQYAQDAEALRGQAAQKFQGQKFQGQEYTNTQNAENAARAKHLQGQIAKLVQQYQSFGGDITELAGIIGLQDPNSAVENEEF